ncbi:MAG: aldehyde dehydrogenase family protein [Acidovorax sp.]
MRSSAIELKMRSIHQALNKNLNEIKEVLLEHAHHRAVETEIDSALQAIAGASVEINEYTKGKRIRQMAVYMPSNMALYFYVLYVLIPSCYADEVHFRASGHITNQTKRIHQIFSVAIGTNAYMHEVTQKDFTELYTRTADVVVFTGTYKNSEKLRHNIKPGAMYLFFGQGVNPVIVNEDADIGHAVQDVISARLFNTGQDCMCPNAIFVHEKIVRHFTEKLLFNLKDLKFGSNNNREADYGPIYYQGAYEELLSYLAKNHQYVIHDGVINIRTRRIDPVVMLGRLGSMAEIKEYFGPVFNIIEFSDNEILLMELHKSFYEDRAMGISVYGSMPGDGMFSRYMLSRNKTLFDIEDPNRPFGGKGQMANYLYYEGKILTKPLLISDAIGTYSPGDEKCALGM